MNSEMGTEMKQKKTKDQDTHTNLIINIFEDVIEKKKKIETRARYDMIRHIE